MASPSHHTVCPQQLLRRAARYDSQDTEKPQGPMMNQGTGKVWCTRSVATPMRLACAQERLHVCDSRGSRSSGPDKPGGSWAPMALELPA